MVMKKAIALISLVLVVNMQFVSVYASEESLPKDVSNGKHLSVKGTTNYSSSADSAMPFDAIGTNNNSAISYSIDTSTLQVKYNEKIASLYPNPINDSYSFNLSLISDAERTPESELFAGYGLGFNIPYIKNVTESGSSNEFYLLRDGNESKSFYIDNTSNDASPKMIYSKLNNFHLSFDQSSSNIEYIDSNGTRYDFC